jgi:hypothetical protein
MAEVLGIIYGSPDGTLAEQGYACDSKATILAQVADKSSTSNAFEPQSFPSESSSHSITPDSVQVSGGQNQGLDQTDTLASSMPGISSKTNSIYSCANCDRKFERRMDYMWVKPMSANRSQSDSYFLAGIRECTNVYINVRIKTVQLPSPRNGIGKGTR